MEETRTSKTLMHETTAPRPELKRPDMTFFSDSQLYTSMNVLSFSNKKATKLLP